MAVIEELSELLGLPAEKLRFLLEQLRDHPRGAWHDVGGVRGAWTMSRGVVIERYEQFDCSPEDLL